MVTLTLTIPLQILEDIAVGKVERAHDKFIGDLHDMEEMLWKGVLRQAISKGEPHLDVYMPPVAN